jgi:quercetin dioxygenase-like cupin family protein
MSVIVMRDSDKPWLEPPEGWEGTKPGGTRLTYKSLMPISPGQPNLQRTRYEPRHFVPPHSHPEDEVIYILAGSIALGDQTLNSGDALFVPRDTRYSLRAGDDGAEFVRVGMGA